ncbi:MAG: DUF2220 family protein [Clostridia bacterium]
MFYNSAGSLPPARKQFYQLLAKSEKPFVLWGDIDLGGMIIFLQIREIIPHLQSFRMDCTTLNEHMQDTILCNAAYLAKCKLAMSQPSFRLFEQVLKWMVTNRRTLEP